MALPAFINQLLLMLNSGMVLQEAMERVALNYELKDADGQNSFILAYTKIYRDCRKSGENFMKSFCRFGNESTVKELSRVARILADGDARGTDMWNRLADEGEELWAERKRIAMERIRIAESKMSFPLGLILMGLVIITAAPAMMQMYID